MASSCAQDPLLVKVGISDTWLDVRFTEVCFPFADSNALRCSHNSNRKLAGEVAQSKV
jgi:hypothetical protein